MKYLLLVLLSFGISVSANSQSVIGSWKGMIDVGAKKIAFIMHVSQKEDAYITTFDSPDQKAFGLKGGETIVNGDSIKAKIPVIRGSYNALWDGRNTMEGTFAQGNFKTTLQLKRISDSNFVKKYIPKVRPQTPVAPFPYKSEEVVYHNADKSIQFGATLTTPTDLTDFPTVIIISGSGAQDRNGTMFEHQPYFVLADYLTKNGIAVLRVDDRGTGLTNVGNDPLKLTSVDFAKDVESGLQYLLTRNDINPKKIGLIGHSEGGMIAPMVAINTKKIAFLALLAAPGIKGDEILKFQMKRNFVKKNLLPEDDLKATGLVNGMMDAFKLYSNADSIKNYMQDYYKKWKVYNNEEVESNLLYTKGDKAFLNIADQFSSALVWLKYFMNYDPSINLSALKLPVLAVNGESDIQIEVKANLEGINAALKKGRNRKYTLRSFPDLNHLFQTCKSANDPYDSIEETFSPIALKFISDWINSTMQ
jgi:fermentation-respiration switch protein FrsA (DUF1100 family)